MNEIPPVQTDSFRTPGRGEPFGIKLRPEFQFLVTCLRARLANDRTLADRSIPVDIDWDLFLASSARHKTSAFVGSFLQDCPAVPTRVRQTLREKVLLNQQRAALHLAELARITGHLTTHGVQVLTLKGPVLSWQIHEDIAWRQVGDLDIIVSPGAVDAADRLLREQGYRLHIPDRPLTPSETTRYRKRCPHYTYVHPERKVFVELHWRLMCTHGFLPLTFEEMWEGRQPVRLGNFEFATLSTVHLPLHLYCHGAHHQWERLCWIYDIAVLQSRQIGDWQEIRTLARRLGLERVIAQGSIMSDWLHSVTAGETNPQTTYMVQVAFKNLTGLRGTMNPKRWERMHYRLKIGRRLDYKRNVLIEELFQTPILPFSAAPGFLLLFYALGRPFFWARRKTRDDD